MFSTTMINFIQKKEKFLNKRERNLSLEAALVSGVCEGDWPLLWEGELNIYGKIKFLFQQ